MQFLSENQTLTTNGMPTLVSSLSKCVDFFFAAGASRGKDLSSVFMDAYAENQELALRIMQWARDVRGGAGERDLYRSLLVAVESTDIEVAKKMAEKTPEIGRWDDLFVFKTAEMQTYVFDMFANALTNGNKLCAKWSPRKGPIASQLRTHMKLTPKQYRKLVVGLTEVVETKMCAKDYGSINYNQVPSLAASRYRKAFKRNDGERYGEWVESLTKPESGAKVNAGAIFPHDVIKPVLKGGLTSVDEEFVAAQWKALPSYGMTGKVLPLVDVSGSMSSNNVMNVAVALGLLISERNTCGFKDTIMTFSEDPQLFRLNGTTITQRVREIMGAPWGMSTNLMAAFDRLLDYAVAASASQEHMPSTIVILSDMQFNQADRTMAKGDSFSEIKARFDAAGYKMPNLVYWNLAGGNAPVKMNQNGVALVSGFSPSVMESVLSGEGTTPEGVMLRAVMIDRYALT